MLVPHIDDMEVSLRRLADDEAATVGSTRELVQKALKRLSLRIASSTKT